jgi:hypothetical protein
MLENDQDLYATGNNDYGQKSLTSRGPGGVNASKTSQVFSFY